MSPSSGWQTNLSQAQRSAFQKAALNLFLSWDRQCLASDFQTEKAMHEMLVVRYYEAVNNVVTLARIFVDIFFVRKSSAEATEIFRH